METFQRHLVAGADRPHRPADSVVTMRLGSDRERWVMGLEHLHAAVVLPRLARPPVPAAHVAGIAQVHGEVWTVVDAAHLIRGVGARAVGEGWLTLLRPSPAALERWGDDPRVAVWWSDIADITARDRFTPVDAAAVSAFPPQPSPDRSAIDAPTNAPPMPVPSVPAPQDLALQDQGPQDPARAWTRAVWSDAAGSLWRELDVGRLWAVLTAG